MEKFKLWIVIVHIACSAVLFGNELNIYNQFSINIPDEFNVTSINSDLFSNEDESQYGLYVQVEFIYKNALLNLSITLYGTGDINNLLNSLNFKKEIKKYSNIYLTAVDTHILQEYKQSLVNINGKTFSRLFSSWPSGWTSDVIGYAYLSDDNLFNEIVIRTMNAWDALGAKQKLLMDDTEFNTKIQTEEKAIKDFYTFYENMIGSINFHANAGMLVSEKNKYKNREQNDTLVFPSSDNINLLSSPQLNATKIGIVNNRPYEIIEYGKKEIIQGEKGQWLKIKGLNINIIGWVFSSKLHIATQDEIFDFFDNE